MELLVAFLTPIFTKYILYILPFLISLGALYFIFLRYLDQEREAAIAKNKVAQLEQIIKDREKHIEQLNEINNRKSEIINNTIKENEQLTNKLKEIEINIEKEVVKGNDKPASNILKDTFKKLSGQK
jgi:hypothetical protein